MVGGRLETLTDGRAERAADARTGSAPAGRRRRVALAAVAALAGAAVALSPGGERGTSAPPPPARGSPAAGQPDVYAPPARGSLAGDRAFLAAVRRLPWDPPPPGPREIRTPVDPPVDARRVVWAGDVPRGRWALVVTSEVYWETPLPPGTRRVPTGDLVAAWFTGPAGARAEELRMQATPHLVPAPAPSALHDPRTGVLLVLAAPGDVVEVSQRREITEHAMVERSFEPVGTDDGVAVVRLEVDDLPYSHAVQYRIRRDGAVGEPIDATSVLPRELPPGETLRMTFPRGRPDAAGRATAERAGLDALAALGVSRADTELTAAWVGGMPGTDAGRAAVVTMAQPSGALLVRAGWSFTPPGASRVDGRCRGEVLPASARGGTLVVECTVLDPVVPVDSFLVVVAPGPVTTVRLHAADGDFLSEHAAVDGVAVTPWPAGTATAEAVTGQGVSLGRVPLPGTTRPADVILD